MFHRSDLVLLMAMHCCGTSLVMSDTRKVDTMQPQEPDVANTGLRVSCREKNCCNNVESISDVIYVFKACMLEHDRVDGENGVNIGGICTFCEQSFDHTWRVCSGCRCQACQQVLDNRGMYERNCLNESGDVTQPLVSSSSKSTRCHNRTLRRESA